MKTFLKATGLTLLVITLIMAIPLLVVLWPLAIVIVAILVPGIIIGIIASHHKE